MDKDRRSQPHNQPVESQLPVRWKVQVEDEPAAGRSPAEAVLSEEHHGPLTPFQADHGLPSEPLNCEGEPLKCEGEPLNCEGEPLNCEGKLRGLPASCPIASRVSQVLTLFFDLRRAMRRLRRELNVCQSCQAGVNCMTWQQYQTIVHRSVLEVNQEWSPS